MVAGRRVSDGEGYCDVHSARPRAEGYAWLEAIKVAVYIGLMIYNIDAITVAVPAQYPGIKLHVSSALVHYDLLSMSSEKPRHSRTVSRSAWLDPEHHSLSSDN